MRSTPPTAHRKTNESRWIESESIRLLMQSRRGGTGIAALAMLLMAVQVYEYVNPWLVLAWVAASWSILVARYRLKLMFLKQFDTAKRAAKLAFIERSGLFWSANAFTWGVSGWLFFADIPIQNQYICVTILNIVGFVAVHNLSAHRKTSRQFINVLVGTQMVGALWHIGVTEQFESPPIQYIHLISLAVSWVFFRVLDNRFYGSFHRNLSLEYRNTNLIKSLSRQTERLEHEKRVVMNANETIKRFYSSAAHDIRQPVYALNVYSDLVTDDPSQALKLMPKIKASCHAINALFHSLFDFEKIHAGQVTVSLETVDLDLLFADLQAHFLPLAAAKQLDFRIKTFRGRLQSDPALIKGILSHLIANAIKYTHQGGLLVAARKTAHSVSFEVWDTGIGIDHLHQAHVFDEFFKVNEQSSADEGFGLGLSVVKRLAALVEGSSVTLQSRSGRGSVFKFRVPLAAYANSANPPTPSALPMP